MTTASDTDRIERSILINATRARVWRALSNAEEFGAWFGVNLAGQVFAPGVRARGQLTHCGHEDIVFDALIERIEPEDVLSFHWHPYAVDPAIDYAQEQPTLVTFTLADAPGDAILLTVVESGFDKVPPQRRRQAFEMNSGGWEAQLKNIARHAGSQ
ncbi:MAG: vanillate O-demethylase oxidoreductase VanB [Massilia sp.]|jgi:uncharacterized protein YndB with AHSA1/START domain|nr:vanillate O-demethylase oxidoreductase VanB [Massilia sp.]